MKTGHMALALGVLASVSGAARADVKLQSLFSDDMVLQRDKPAPVWGTADAGERVTVNIAGQSQSVVADASGHWLLRLAPLKVATGLTMRVNGKNSLVLHNVAVGDVYLCSGQSNMEYPLQTWSAVGSVPYVAAQKEIAGANYPNIRLLMVAKNPQVDPQAEVKAPSSWQVCNSQTAGIFSAVGYYFGRDLHRALGIPIGLIDSTWGGTYIEAWTSRQTLSTVSPYPAQIAAMQDAAHATAPMSERMVSWWKTEPGTIGNWQNPDFDDTSWKEMTLPQTQGWGTAGLPDYHGVVWFRKTIDVPANWSGQDLTLHLGALDDRDATYWNGTQVGSGYDPIAPRHYTVPGNLVKEGRNVIAVAVLDTGGLAGFMGGDKMRLEHASDAPIALDNAWKYQPTATLDKLAPAPLDFGNNPNRPTVLYNGMIAPLVPFALRGVIWYQGETNAGAPVIYRTLMPNLIRDWRARFGQENLGFYWVQLANYMVRNPQPENSDWAELREAQTMTLSVPHTGMATIIDIGEADDIHPKDKRDVGYRLAVNALAKDYGRKIEYSGPMFEKLKTEGNTLRVKLSHAKGLKTSDGTAPRGFAIAGADKNFVWAQAKISGQSVILSSPNVANPKYVRYGWANNPDVNVYNGVGLPAVPFRSDINDKH